MKIVWGIHRPRWYCMVVLLVGLTGLTGCPSPPETQDGGADLLSPADLTSRDLATPPDQIVVDQRPPQDLVGLDLVTLPDLRPPADLTSLADLTAPPPDQTVPADLTTPPVPDLAVPSDLTVPRPDLTAPLPDLTAPPADLTQGQVSCTDGVRNGNETDTDCGGGTCPRCATGLGCQASRDCMSNVCDTSLATPVCILPTSCRTLNQATPGLPSGTYRIDPDGAGSITPFDVYCDMVTNGGGWTLITSFAVPPASRGGVSIVNIVDVDNSTTITPTTQNATNRNMRLPGITEVLTVNDDQDVGFDGFDKMEVYRGVTGLFDNGGATFTWQDILDGMNLGGTRAWVRSIGGVAPDDAWQFDVVRINTDPTTCLQVPLRGQYGDGNHGGSNSVNGPSGVSSLGMIWHHWDNEGFVSGVNGSNVFRCTLPGAPDPITSTDLPLTYWRATFLR